VKNEYVYFAYAERWDGIYVKIGYSINPADRMHGISKPGSKANLIVAVPGTYGQEQALHHIFKLKRAQQPYQAEWYVPNGRLYRVMLYCLKHGQLPELIQKAGDCYTAIRKFEKDFADLMPQVSEFFRHDDTFGISTQNDPFCRKTPPIDDSNWMAELLTKATTED